MTSVASFDVFDTVLTRAIGGPHQVFVEVGRLLRDQGVTDLDPRAYAAVRLAVQQELTLDTGNHPPIQAIATEVALRLGLAEDGAARLVDAETHVEQSTCRAVPGSQVRVADARAETGRGVVFVSDTPLPGEFLQQLLHREGLFLPGDRLYCSADAGSSKQEGGLFDVVVRDLGVEASELVHCGDDVEADVVNARLHGVTAHHDGAGRFTLRENELDAAGVATDGVGPLLAAASRFTRLQARAQGSDTTIAAIAGGTALPTIAGFAAWIVHEARRLRLDRLYFLARDGQVVLDAVVTLTRHLDWAVDCRYLYGSRRAWQLAAAGREGSDPFSDLWVPGKIDVETTSARQVFRHLDVPLELVADHIGSGGSSAGGDLDEPLGAAAWGRLSDSLRASGVADVIGSRLRKRCADTLLYLDQEGVTAAGRVGFVDVGWSGRAAASLEQVLRSADRPLPVAHLYLGLLEAAPDVMGPELYTRSRGWLIDEARGRSAPPGNEDPVMLLESLLMGDEGTTSGYVSAESRVSPDLADIENPAIRQWHFADYRRSLEWGLQVLSEGRFLDKQVDLRPLAWSGLLRLWRSPTRDEARRWGAQPYGEDYANTEVYPLARRLTVRRILTGLHLGPSRWREPVYWRAGTFALSSTPLRQAVSLGKRIAPFRMRARRIPRRLKAEWLLRSKTRT